MWGPLEHLLVCISCKVALGFAAPAYYGVAVLWYSSWTNPANDQSARWVFLRMEIQLLVNKILFMVGRWLKALSLE